MSLSAKHTLSRLKQVLGADADADQVYNVINNITYSSTGLALGTYLVLNITDTDGTAEGSLWYDASEDKLKFKTAAGVETITSS